MVRERRKFLLLCERSVAPPVSLLKVAAMPSVTLSKTQTFTLAGAGSADQRKEGKMHFPG